MADITDLGVDPESGLLLHQRVFVDHFITYSTPQTPVAVAARKAYFAAGYSAQTIELATTNALDMLNNPRLRGWLDLKIQQRLDTLSVRAVAILLELVLIATASPSYYRINPDTGEIEVQPGIPSEYLRAVSSVEQHSTRKTLERANGDVETTVKWTGRFRLHDKLKALALLCQHMGLTDAELPPLEVLLNRLPPNVSARLREALRQPAGYRPPKVGDTEPTKVPT